MTRNAVEVLDGVLLSVDGLPGSLLPGDDPRAVDTLPEFTRAAA